MFMATLHASMHACKFHCCCGEEEGGIPSMLTEEGAHTVDVSVLIDTAGGWV